MAIPGAVDEAAIREALRLQQADPDAHDRSLIVERLGWTPEVDFAGLVQRMVDSDLKVEGHKHGRR